MAGKSECGKGAELCKAQILGVDGEVSKMWYGIQDRARLGMVKLGLWKGTN